MKTDNNPEQFRFCTVKISGVRQAYTYLTGTLVLNEGDWVEIPFGKYNTLRRGQIESVFSCTRDNAPWPPEKSKTVLRIVDPPAKTTPEEETQEQDNDADTEYVHAEKEAPIIEEKPEERIISTTPQIIPEVPKKPIAWKAVLCAALVLASVLTIILVRHNMKSHYEKAETYVITGEYTEAAAELEKVPASYKEQKLLKSFTIFADDTGEETYIEEMFDYEEAEEIRKRKKSSPWLLAILLAVAGTSDKRHKHRHNGRCDGDCANCPPHYGYRYGRWYYGHGHTRGCVFGGNKGDGSLPY